MIWFEVVGEASPDRPILVLCDGIGCDGFVWRYIVERFAEDHQLVRWHYRGHGQSRRPTNLAHLSLQHLAHDLIGVLNAAKIHRPVVLLGHSMGVQVVFEIYRQAPERIAAMVPICGSYGHLADNFYDTRGLVRPAFERTIALAKTAPRVFGRVWRRLLTSRVNLMLARLVEVNSARVSDEDFWPYFEHLGRLDVEVFFRMLEFAIDHSTESLLPHVEVPVLIIAGDRDGFTPLHCSERLHSDLPDSELVVLYGGSHTTPIEFPERVEFHLERFLDRCAQAEEISRALLT